MQTVDVGETWPLISWWWDANDDGAEPSAITLAIEPPTGATINKTKPDMTGTASVDGDTTLDQWAYALPITLAGVWRYTFTGTVSGTPVIQSGMFLAGADGERPGPCEPWCSWPDVEALCEGVEVDTIQTGVRERLIDLATDILWSLDGRRYPGICTRTRRICRTCTRCITPSCCCGTTNAIDLGRRWPVWGVWDVVVDGETLPNTAYALRDQRWLDRLDGSSWPACASLTDPDAFHVSYAFGRRPPFALAEAAAQFAAELAKSCIEGAECALPERVTVITREEVTYTILDSQRYLTEGRTGIYLVDLALEAARQGRKARPGMMAPH